MTNDEDTDSQSDSTRHLRVQAFKAADDITTVHAYKNRTLFCVVEDAYILIIVIILGVNGP